MFMTPRPFKRRLDFTPYATPKRSRLTSYTGRVAQTARRVVKGPRRTGTLVQQVKALQNAVAALGPELKTHDQTLSLTNITTGHSITHITAIAQGDTVATRTGNAVILKKLNFRGGFTESSMTDGNHYRLCIVQDKQQVADTDPSISDIFNPSSPNTVLPNVNSLERYRVIWMSNSIGGTNTKTGFGPSSWEYSTNLNVRVGYNGTAGTDIQKNGLYFIVLSDDVSDTVDFSGIVRLQYTDV